MNKSLVILLLSIMIFGIVAFPALAGDAYANARAVFAPGLADYLPDAAGNVTINYAKNQGIWKLTGSVQGLVPNETYYLALSVAGSISYVYRFGTDSAGGARIKGVSPYILPAYENVFVNGPASSVPGESGAVLVASESNGGLTFRGGRRGK